MSCKLSPICMKCQYSFLGEKKKKTNKKKKKTEKCFNRRLLKILSRVLALKCLKCLKSSFLPLSMGCVQLCKMIANVLPWIPVPNDGRQSEQGSRAKHSGWGGVGWGGVGGGGGEVTRDI